MNINEVKVIKLKAGTKEPAQAAWTERGVTYAEAQAMDPSHRQWGMLHGPINNTWLLDVDVKNGGPATLARLEAEHGPMPEGPRVHTKNAGVHYLLQWEDGRPVRSRVGVLPGIDTRGLGGQSVIPPSEGYRWENLDLPVPPAPEWLMRLVAPEEVEQDKSERPVWMWSDEQGAREEARRYMPAIQGDPRQNGTRVSFLLAQVLVRGWGLSPEKAFEVMCEEWNPRCVPPWEGGELKQLERVCERAETVGQSIPWGARFYSGMAKDIMLRAIVAYGPPGNTDALVPYQVWPDGRMMKLGAGNTSIAAALIRICKDQGLQEPKPDQALALANWWRLNVTSRGLFPPAIVLDDQPGPSLARLYVQEGPTPNWDEFLGRMDDPEMFLAWLWMVTLPRATRQILWITGDGHDGKTAVSAVLARLLGEACVTVQDHELEGDAGRWLGARCYGKRLLILDDTKMRGVGRRGPVHKLTGGSAIPMEEKGRPAFDYRPNLNVLVTANVTPDIGGSRADKTRLIPLTVQKGRLAPDVGWEERMYGELPAVFARAKVAYEKWCTEPGQPSIRLSEIAAPLLERATQGDDIADDDALAAIGLYVGGEGTVRAGELADRLRMDVRKPVWLDFKKRLLARGVTEVKERVGPRILHGVSPILT